ncbi:MAG: ornithine cyclodeaminase family protein [Ilumatobacter sp.]|nr:ornithine cyclodeaminase family protein [Ilumatobacter sp.]
MAPTRILSQSCISRIVADVGLDELLDQLIERLIDACRDHEPTVTEVIPRDGFTYSKPDLGLIEWMPVMDLGRRVAVKTVGYHPTNPAERGAPSVLATTSLHDTTDGRLLALCEATFLTALRTGAASAVASDILAVEDATTLGVVGCGAQAVTQIHALTRVRPIERIIAFDANETVAVSLDRRLRRAGLDVRCDITGDVGDVVRESDVLCTATSVDPDAGPVVTDGEHRPWLHVNAVGSDHPGKIELPRSLLQRARVFPDLLAQCLAEGESQQLDPESLGPEMPVLVQQRSTHEAFRGELTVFDSTGWALEDLIAAELALDHAERLDEGFVLDLQPSPRDPHDPYEFLWR